MTREEIDRHLATGSTRSVCIDKSIVEQLPWYVRTVTIRRNWVVFINFKPYGFDEMGVYFQGSFESFEAMQTTLEHYLGKPLSEWHNYTASGNYPDEPVNERPKMTWDEIKAVARTLRPSQGNFIEIK
jgi:hypothetical protein